MEERLIDFVVVPRKVARWWWARPWTEVFAAAEAGEDGLRVYRNKVIPQYWPNGWTDWDTVAILREGGPSWPPNTTLVAKQNW